MRQDPRFFDACGVITGEDGLWLRKQFLILAQNNNTDVAYWASQSLIALRPWIKANNAVVEDRKESGNGK